MPSESRTCPKVARMDREDFSTWNLLDYFDGEFIEFISDGLPLTV
jgi:hypothetical protein